ncbi:MAG: transposase [Bacteroidaceae bacterium]|nr:transposase [Bacteroidaceae bacterium]
MMVGYAQSLLTTRTDMGIGISAGIQEKMNYLQEVLDDMAVRAMVCKDTDVRYGHKSTNKPFTGYKIHISETEDGFITAAIVTSGEKGDGAILPLLIEKTEENGLDDIEEVIADTAYCTKENIETCDTKDIKLVAPLHPSINGFRDENDGFIYNKDAQSVTCPAGELAVKKSFKKANPKKKNNAHYDYYFDVNSAR